MMKLLIVPLVIFSGLSYAQVQSSIQSWECALDLHQGDKGTLSLNREGNSLDGVIKFLRNDNVFESAVSGNWVDNEIDLIRLLDANSTELMAGVVVPLGTKKMNVGGRYSTDYQGVWSANCDLVSELKNTEKTENKSFTSTKVTPPMPTEKQKVRFSVSASHPDGIEQLSIYLGSDKIHTCKTNECEFSYGPLSKGIYSWRVEGLGNDGLQSIEVGRVSVQSSYVASQLTVAPRKVNKCSISGRAIGGNAPLAQVYSVKLYGPNSKTLLNGSSGFDNGVYQFNNLSEGQYQLTIDKKADQEILVSPVTTILNCGARSTLTQNFSFN